MMDVTHLLTMPHAAGKKVHTYIHLALSTYHRHRSPKRCDPIGSLRVSNYGTSISYVKLALGMAWMRNKEFMISSPLHRIICSKQLLWISKYVFWWWSGLCFFSCLPSHQGAKEMYQFRSNDFALLFFVDIVQRWYLFCCQVLGRQPYSVATEYSDLIKAHQYHTSLS